MQGSHWQACAVLLRLVALQESSSNTLMITIQVRKMRANGEELEEGLKALGGCLIKRQMKCSIDKC